MDFIDKVFARRLEAAEEFPQVEFARYYQRTKPEVGAEVAELCGGHMSFCGKDSPVGRAVGMGLTQPLTEAELARVEEFYHARGVPAQLDITPLHDGELFALLQQRGYYIAELNNVLWRRLDASDEFPVASGDFRMHRGEVSEAKNFIEIAAHCFYDAGEPPEEFREMFAPLFYAEDTVSFMATVDGIPAGVATGQIIPERQLVALFGAGTLPKYRRRGIQTALLVERMKTAREYGCDIAVIVTQGGTISQRNAERLGFRLAYSKATVIKHTKREF